MEVEKIIIPKTGNYGVFELLKFPAIELKASQIRIQVAYSGINFADVMMRQGIYPDAPKLPFCPGYEVSGTVLECASDVVAFKPGDRVVAGCYFNGYASEVVVPVRQVRKLPLELSLKQGAALPVSFITAHLALFELGGVRPGQNVLIDCLTGSLGQVCHHLLKQINCQVVGLTTSVTKKQIYADKGIELMTKIEWERDRRSFDFILNSWGGDSIKTSYEKLDSLGRLCCVGVSNAVGKGARNWFKIAKTVLTLPRFFSANLMNDSKMVGGLNVLRVFNHPKLDSALDAMEKTDYVPHVSHVYNGRTEVAKAHQYLQEKKSNGKVLLSW